MTSFHFRVGEGENIRMDKFLSAEIQDYSRTQIQQAIREGNALVDGEAQKASFLLSGGEEVEITISLPDTVSDSVEPEPIPLDIVFEDGEVNPRMVTGKVISANDCCVTVDHDGRELILDYSQIKTAKVKLEFN